MVIKKARSKMSGLTALDVPGLFAGAKLQRRFDDAHRELVKHLAGTGWALLATNAQMKAGARTLFAIARKRQK